MIKLELDSFENLKLKMESEKYPEWVLLRFLIEKKAIAKKNKKNKRYFLLEKDFEEKEKLISIEKEIKKHKNKNKNLYIDFVQNKKVNNLLKNIKKSYKLENFKFKTFPCGNFSFFIIYDFENKELENSCSLLNIFKKEENSHLLPEQENEKPSLIKKLLRKVKN